MSGFSWHPAVVAIASVALAYGCTVEGPLPKEGSDCTREGEAFCRAGVFHSCEERDGLIAPVRVDCAERGERCSPTRGCTVCAPRELGCSDGNVARCSDDGSAWMTQAECDHGVGEACVQGRCTNLCERARGDRSYQGCDFFAVDLDQASELGNDVGQYALVVANPTDLAAQVQVFVDTDPARGVVAKHEQQSVQVEANDLEVILLDHRPVDGSAGGVTPTHSAETSAAYRVTSSVPVMLYQFNPLNAAGTFSTDASLLLPVASAGNRYTVSGWPGVPTAFRPYLTIVGIEPDTKVTVQLGPSTGLIDGAGAAVPPVEDGVIETVLGPFDVLNLEPEPGLTHDFTGSVVEASHPVVVFTGNEGADVPAYDRTGVRYAAADHLEEQLLPDASLGRRYVVPGFPSRAQHVYASIVGEKGHLAGLLDHDREQYWVRVVATVDGTEICTGLEAPRDQLMLDAGQFVTWAVDEGFVVDADQPVSVMQYAGGQGTTPVPTGYPGGDPASLLVPPEEQWRRNTVFLIPETFHFDFVLIAAPKGASVRIDGREVSEECVEHGVAGPSDRVVHHCQVSRPDIVDGTVEPGVQGDGVHRVDASEPVGVVAYGFDEYVSYAYVAGIDVVPLR